MRKRLSETAVQNLLKRRPKNREDYYDTTHTGFCLRLTPAGKATYGVFGRFGRPNSSHRKLFDARTVAYSTALAKAKEWLELDQQHKDPKIVEARRAGHAFDAVADDFVRERVRGVQRPRQVKQTERHIALMRERFGAQQIHDIKRDDLVKLIKSKGSTPSEARNLKVTISRLFGWAREQTYGLESNVAADIKLKFIIDGHQNTRDRVLSIDEVGAIWRATSKLGPMFQAAYQVLILSGLRLNECAGARWEEFDFANRTWTVPASRMKGTKKSAKPFVVPLTGRMIGILNSLPRSASGVVFTVNSRNPVTLGSTHVKRQLAAALDIEPFFNHDLRRAISSGLTKLGVKETVADAVLAHRKRGVEGRYNLHQYVEERRAALELWGDTIAPNNVTPLRRAV